MDVELTGVQASLFAAKLGFDMKWSLDGDTPVSTTHVSVGSLLGIGNHTAGELAQSGRDPVRLGHYGCLRGDPGGHRVLDDFIVA